MGVFRDAQRLILVGNVRMAGGIHSQGTQRSNLAAAVYRFLLPAGRITVGVLQGLAAFVVVADVGPAGLVQVQRGKRTHPAGRVSRLVAPSDPVVVGVVEMVAAVCQVRPASRVEAQGMLGHLLEPPGAVRAGDLPLTRLGGGIRGPGWRQRRCCQRADQQEQAE